MPSLRSECALRSLGLFGLTTDDVARHDDDLASSAAAHAANIHRSLRAGQLALITGPSAAGKSSVLRALAQSPSSIAPPRAREENIRAIVIDSLAPTSADLPAALRALSAAGLADAFLPARPISHLSEGERARLVIARAILAAERLLAIGTSPTILLDDFADNLDDATAASVAFTLRRWLAHHPRVRMVIVTLRPRVAAHLRPDLTLDLGLGATVLRTGSSRSVSDHRAENPLYCSPQLAITAGTLADYDALSHHHYRAARPATIAAVLVARFVQGQEESRFGESGHPEPSCLSHPAAVLTISMPTLNGAWRRAPGPISHHRAPTNESPPAS